jgi:hypothetical protein
MNIIEYIYRNLLEGIVFVITVIALFTLFADFGQKIGLIAQTIEIGQMQYLGFISAGFGVLNLLSGRFFEIKLLSS